MGKGIRLNAVRPDGNFNRHAKWDRRSGAGGFDFPRHGGYFVRAYAEAWADADAADQAILRDGIETQVGYFSGNRTGPFNALPSASDGDYVEEYWTGNNLMMSIEYHEAMQLLPPDLQALIQAELDIEDVTALAPPHAPSSPTAAFTNIALVDTMQPGSARGREYLQTEAWTTGYSEPQSALFARLFYKRYQQNGNSAMRDLALESARMYLTTDRDPSNAIAPGAFADVIDLLLYAFEETEDSDYLDRATELGHEALQLFLKPGSPLPIAHDTADHYETITGGDDLMLALFRLDRAILLQQTGDEARIDVTVENDTILVEAVEPGAEHEVNAGLQTSTDLAEWYEEGHAERGVTYLNLAPDQGGLPLRFQRNQYQAKQSFADVESLFLRFRMDDGTSEDW